MFLGYACNRLGTYFNLLVWIGVFRESSVEHVNDWCFRDIYKGGPLEDVLDVCARLIYIERIAAENKYLERENKQTIPFLIHFMTGWFYIVILFTKRFHGSAD